MTYDAVLAVAPHHAKIAVTAVRSLLDYSSAKRIYVLAAERDVRDLRRAGLPIAWLDENALIPEMDADSIGLYLRRRGANPGRAGWYLQQFLKMAVCEVPDVSEYYLVWDADTVMLRPMEFFGFDDTVLVAPSAEYHHPYFETYRRLLGRERGCDFSFIAEHLMVKKEFMRELLAALRHPTRPGARWAWTVLEAVQDEHLSGSGFSEYETYGNFTSSNHPEAMRPRPLTSLREASSTFGLSPNRYDLARLASSYTYASFETWCRGDASAIVKEKWRSFFTYWMAAPGCHRVGHHPSFDESCRPGSTAEECRREVE